MIKSYTNLFFIDNFAIIQPRWQGKFDFFNITTKQSLSPSLKSIMLYACMLQTYKCVQIGKCKVRGEFLMDIEWIFGN